MHAWRLLALCYVFHSVIDTKFKLLTHLSSSSRSINSQRPNQLKMPLLQLLLRLIYFRTLLFLFHPLILTCPLPRDRFHSNLLNTVADMLSHALPSRVANAS